MALVESNPFPVGHLAPDFVLTDVVSTQQYSRNDLQLKNGLLIVFMCNHCPYVQHILPELVRLADECLQQQIGVVAISSNDALAYPDDAPDKMKQLASDWKFNFPYLYDETQAVAKAYDAACTPDFYLLDGDNRNYYHGRLDGSTPGNDVPLTGADLRQAIKDMLSGKTALTDPPVSRGCSIKWKE